MIVVRFRVECQPAKADQALASLQQIVAPSREIEGVVHFDIGRDVTDENVFIATEVFEDREALDRQEAQRVVQDAMALFGDILAGPPEATVYHVASEEPSGE